MTNDDAAQSKKTERLHMLISPGELHEIDTWRFANRIGTRAEAVRRLVQIGLIFDEHRQQIVDDAMTLYSTFSERVLAATQELTANEGTRDARADAYIEKMFQLTTDTVERLTYHLSLLKIVMQPIEAMKSDESFESAQLGALSAKASSLADLLQLKVDWFNAKENREGD